MAAVDVQTIPLKVKIGDHEGRAIASLSSAMTRTVDSNGMPPKLTFILNSADFINLQLYLKTAFQLPADESQFQVFYPQESFEKFITRNTILYPTLRQELPKIHVHCATFGREIVGAMILLGGTIANFAEEANKEYQRLHNALSKITAPGSPLTDQIVIGAIARATTIIDRFKINAVNTEAECALLVNGLTRFQTTMKEDQVVLVKLKADFVKAQEESHVGTALATFQEKIHQASKVLREYHARLSQDAIDSGSIHWYSVLPFVGPVIVIKSEHHAVGLLHQIEEVKQRILREVALEDVEVLKLAQCQLEFTRLVDDFEKVTGSIQNGIIAVSHMSGAFAGMKTDFDLLEKNLGKVKSDMVEDVAEDRDEDLWPDMNTVSTAWLHVQAAAKIFQENGGIMEHQET